MTAGATENNQGPISQPRAAAASGHAPNPLQRLIQRRLAERSWSYRKVARRAELPRSTVFVLATTRKLTRPPRPATIQALARGLDLPARWSAPPPRNPRDCITTSRPGAISRTLWTRTSTC